MLGLRGEIIEAIAQRRAFLPEILGARSQKSDDDLSSFSLGDRHRTWLHFPVPLETSNTSEAPSFLAGELVGHDFETIVMVEQGLHGGIELILGNVEIT